MEPLLIDILQSIATGFFVGLGVLIAPRLLFVAICFAAGYPFLGLWALLAAFFCYCLRS